VLITVFISKHIEQGVVNGIDDLRVNPVRASGPGGGRRPGWASGEIERGEPGREDGGEGGCGAAAEGEQLFVRSRGEEGGRAGGVVWEEGGSKGAEEWGEAGGVEDVLVEEVREGPRRRFSWLAMS